MYAEIAAILTSLKSLGEIAKLTSDVKASAQVIEKTIELNSAILVMQEKMATLHADKDILLQEKKELEHKLAQFEHWEAEAARYELQKLTAGVSVYAVKPSTTKAEPPHWLCTNCYETKRKSILQFKGRGTYGWIHFCPNCKMEIDCPKQGPEDSSG